MITIKKKYQQTVTFFMKAFNLEVLKTSIYLENNFLRLLELQLIREDKSNLDKLRWIIYFRDKI